MLQLLEAQVNHLALAYGHNLKIEKQTAKRENLFSRNYSCQCNDQEDEKGKIERIEFPESIISFKAFVNAFVNLLEKTEVWTPKRRSILSRTLELLELVPTFKKHWPF